MGALQPNWTRFAESLALELTSRANQVRDLIGDSHWLSDGHHKEHLLIRCLNSYLPRGMIAARGFVIDSRDRSERSREQDILIVDAFSEMPLFFDGGLLISFPQHVVASISVKTTFEKKEIADSIEGLSTVARLVRTPDRKDTVWFGAYFFDGTDYNDEISIARAEIAATQLRELQSNCVSQFESHSQPLTCLATASNCFARLQNNVTSSDSQQLQSKLALFRANGFASALFLASLIGHLSNCRGATHSAFDEFFDDETVASITTTIDI